MALPVAPREIGNVAYVPLRVVAEQFGASVRLHETEGVLSVVAGEQTVLIEVGPGGQRPAHAIIQADYAAALRSDTVAAWKAFLAKRPDASLTNEGRQHLGQAIKRLADADWQAAEKQGSEDSLYGFAEQHSDDPRASAARLRAGDLAWQALGAKPAEAGYARFVERYGPDPRSLEARAKLADYAWTRATAADTPEAYDNFRRKHVGDPRAAIATQRIGGEEITVYEAQQRGLVTARVTGSGLGEVRLSLTRTTNRRLRVIVPAGAYFVCQGGGAQNMVGGRQTTVDLVGSATASLSVPASCANMHLDTPNWSTSFAIRPSPEGSELARLMEVIGREQPSEVVAQVAVWAVTDNPTRAELMSTYVTNFGGPAASQADLNAAAQLLRKAGIEPTGKHLFY
ncbi:MAG: hypothetical protein IT204_10370 [Fimbriimonadaceae bacterium]|nr:hypothetical protein [Fimbriimonadaceae bacterium]